MRLRKPQGFTLLEMLVVLMIISLLSLLLMQGFSYLLQLRVRFLDRLDDMQQFTLQRHWFESSSSALIPEYTDLPEGYPFKGEERGFSGLTTMSLDDIPGVPLPCAWYLNYDGGETHLLYRRANQQTWEVMSWPGREGGFRYQDEKGEWHAKWPPSSTAAASFMQEAGPQLPKIIALSGIRRGEIFLWLAEVKSRDKPREDYRIFFKNMGDSTL